MKERNGPKQEQSTPPKMHKQPYGLTIEKDKDSLFGVVTISTGFHLYYSDCLHSITISCTCQMAQRSLTSFSVCGNYIKNWCVC